MAARFIVALPLLATVTGSVPRHVLPETLREHAGSVGCTEIGDFYDRPGRIDPAYAYGVVDPEFDRTGEASAAYWCQRSDTDERYLLVIWLVGTARSAPLAQCPPTVGWQNYPGGITLQRGGGVPLSRFWHRSNPQQPGPSGVRTSGTVIHTEYDGVGAEFYCYEGEWFARQFD